MTTARNKRRQERALERMMEAAIQQTIDYVDPMADMVDPVTGEVWMRIGGAGRDGQERLGIPGTEQELSIVRRECRTLATLNEFAINGHENRINYIVGSGHVYDVQWKKGFAPEKDAPPTPKEGEPPAKPRKKEADPQLEEIKAAVAEFVAVNRWQQRQAETVRRLDRDGEVFLRTFVKDGVTLVRFVEPAQVYAPPSAQVDTFGIKTDPKDVETVLGYWVDGELVDASEIQHRKANVDCNVKRGLPTFWPVRKNLKRAENLLRNMSVVAGIQTAIAIVRKHVGASKSGVEQFIANQATKTVTNSATGQTTNYTRYQPGTILDASAGTEYDFPAQGINATKYVEVLQAELRAISSRLVMPEFMLSSDASNANYSSTMVAEGPAVKMFERLQFAMIEDDTALIRKALIAKGISEDVLDQVDILATPPNVKSTNRLEDVNADKILVDAGAMSRQTLAERNNLDWDQEEDRIEEDDARKRANAPKILPANDGADQSPPKKAPPGTPGEDDEDKPMDEAARAKLVNKLLWEGYP